MAPPIRYPTPLPVPVTENPLAREVRRGLRSGTSGLTAQMYGGGQALAKFAGFEGLAEDAASGYEENMQAAARFQPEVPSVYDIKTPEQALKWVAFRGAELLPSAASMVVGGGTGALAAGALRLPAAVGAATGAYTTSALPQAGGIYRETLDEGGVDAPGPAIAGGALGGAVEMLPLLRGARAITGRGARVPTGRLIAGSIAGEAAAEGTQEGIAIGTRAFADPNFRPTTEEVGHRVGESAAVGALGGTMFGGTSAGVRAFRERLESERTAIPHIQADQPARSTIFDEMSDQDRQHLATLFPEFGPVNTDVGTEADTDMEFGLGNEAESAGRGITFQDALAMQPEGAPERSYGNRWITAEARAQVGAKQVKDTLSKRVDELNEEDHAMRTRDPQFSFDELDISPYRRISLREKVEHDAQLAHPDDPLARREYVINEAKNEFTAATGRNSLHRIAILEGQRADVREKAALYMDPATRDNAIAQAMSYDPDNAEGGVSRELHPVYLAEMDQHLTNQIAKTREQQKIKGDIDYEGLWTPHHPEAFLDHFEVIAGPETPAQTDYSMVGRLGQVQDTPGVIRKPIVKRVTMKDNPEKKIKKYTPTKYEWAVPGTTQVINFPNLLTEMRQQYARFNKEAESRSPREEALTQLGIGMDLIAQVHPEISPEKWNSIDPNQLIEDTRVNPNLRWGDLVPKTADPASVSDVKRAFTIPLVREAKKGPLPTQTELSTEFRLTENKELPEPSPDNPAPINAIEQPRGKIVLPLTGAEPATHAQSELDTAKERTPDQRRATSKSTMLDQAAARIDAVLKRVIEAKETRMGELVSGAKRVKSGEMQQEARDELAYIDGELEGFKKIMADPKADAAMLVGSESAIAELQAEKKVWTSLAEIPQKKLDGMLAEMREAYGKEAAAGKAVRTKRAAAKKADDARKLEGKLSWRKVDEEEFAKLLKDGAIEKDFGVKHGRMMVVRDPQGRRVVGDVSVLQGEFVPTKPPPGYESIAGIGSRDINAEGQKAIQDYLKKHAGTIDTIQSGGAPASKKGAGTSADLVFADVGNKNGINTIIHSFKGHNGRGLGTKKIHTKEALEAADEALKEVNEAYLHRRFPPTNQYVQNLLRRSAYQVANADAVIAVAPIDGGVVEGGTAWAVYLGAEAGIPVHVFDTKTNQWTTYEPFAEPETTFRITDRKGLGTGTYTKWIRKPGEEVDSTEGAKPVQGKPEPIGETIEVSPPQGPVAKAPAKAGQEPESNKLIKEKAEKPSSKKAAKAAKKRGELEARIAEEQAALRRQGHLKKSGKPQIPPRLEKAASMPIGNRVPATTTPKLPEPKQTVYITSAEWPAWRDYARGKGPRPVAGISPQASVTRARNKTVVAAATIEDDIKWAKQVALQEGTPRNKHGDLVLAAFIKAHKEKLITFTFGNEGSLVVPFEDDILKFAINLYRHNVAGWDVVEKSGAEDFSEESTKLTRYIPHTDQLGSLWADLANMYRSRRDGDVKLDLSAIKDGTKFTAGNYRWTKGKKGDEYSNMNLCHTCADSTVHNLNKVGVSAETASIAQRDMSGKTKKMGDHKVAVTWINGKTYIVDHPQREMFKPLSPPRANKATIQSPEFQPRFIEATAENLVKYYGYSKDHAAFKREKPGRYVKHAITKNAKELLDRYEKGVREDAQKMKETWNKEGVTAAMPLKGFVGQDLTKPQAQVDQTSRVEAAKRKQAERKEARGEDPAGANVIGPETAAYNPRDVLTSPQAQVMLKQNFRKKRKQYGPATSQTFTAMPLKEFVGQDLSKLQAQVDQISRKLGLPNPVVALDTKAAMAKAPSEWRSAMADGRLHGFTLAADPKTGRVELWVNPAYDAETQAEILAHEMGHAVFRSETMALDARAARNIMREFTRWMRKYKKGSVQALVHSKKTPKAQLLYMMNGMSSTPVESLAATEQAYFLDFEEWFADEVSKWLGKTGKAPTGTQKFFHTIGQVITRLYRMVRPSYKSVNSYLESLVGGSRVSSAAVPVNGIFQAAMLPNLLDSNVKQLRKGLGDFWGDRVAAASITHAFPDMHLELLNARDLRVVGRAVLSPFIQRQLHRLVDDRTLDLSEPDTALEQAYSFWSQDALEMGPQAGSAFQRARTRAQDVLGVVRDMDGARQIFEAMARGTAQVESTRRGRSITQRYLPDSVADHVVKRLQPAWDVAAKPMRAVFVTIDDRIRATGNPALIQVANKLHKIQGGAPGKATMWQNKPQYRAGFEARVRRVFDGLGEEDAGPILDYLYGAKPINEAPARYKATITKLQKLMQDMLQYQRDAGVDIRTKGKDYFPWVLDLDKMEEDRAGFYQVVNQEKYKQDRIEVATGWNTRTLNRMWAGLPADRERENIDMGKEAAHYARHGRVSTKMQQALLDAGQMGAADKLIQESEVGEAVYNHSMVAGGYMDAEGDVDVSGTPSMRFINQRVLGFVDPAEIRPWLSNDLGMTLQAYINSAVKHTEYVRQFGQGGEKLTDLLKEAWNDYDASPEELMLAQDYVDASMGTYGRETAERLNRWFGIKMPAPWSPINENVSRFMGGITFFQNLIYLGMATLTSLADPMGIAVRSGEFRTMFSGMKSWLQSVQQTEGPNRLQDLAETLGMVEHADIAEALGFRYDGAYMTGRVAGWNHKLFQMIGLNAWTRQTRLMGVASAESFIARHKREPNKHSQRYLEELGLKPADIKLNKDGKLDILSYSERQKLHAALETSYESARKYNKRAEGAEGMGHFEETGEKSLPLSAKEKKVRATADVAADELARDDRVRSAITQFTDEAILRPNPSMRTLWGSDPHFQLFQYLKSFMYAFHDRILRRWWHETMNGNYTASIALLSFIPLLLVLDMIRDLIQHGGEDPIKADWGLWEYTTNAADRAGLTGIYSQLFDVTAGPEELASPLFGTIGNIWEGDAKKLAPLNVVWEDWVPD